VSRQHAFVLAMQKVQELQDALADDNRKSVPMSAFEGKADMPFCTANVCF